MPTVVYLFGGPVDGFLVKDSYEGLKAQLCGGDEFVEFTDGPGYKELVRRSEFLSIRTGGPVETPEKPEVKKKGK